MFATFDLTVGGTPEDSTGRSGATVTGNVTLIDPLTGEVTTNKVTASYIPSYGGIRTNISIQSLTNCTPRDVFHQDVAYDWIDAATGTSVRVIPHHPHNAPSVVSVYIGTMPRTSSAHPATRTRTEDDLLVNLSTLAPTGIASTFHGRGPGYLVGAVEAPRGRLAKPVARLYDVVVEKQRKGHGTALLAIWRRILRSWGLSQWRMESLTEGGEQWMYALERKGALKVLYYYPPKPIVRGTASGRLIGVGSRAPAALVEDIVAPDEATVQGQRVRSSRLRWLAEGLAA